MGQSTINGHSMSFSTAILTEPEGIVRSLSINFGDAMGQDGPIRQRDHGPMMVTDWGMVNIPTIYGDDWGMVYDLWHCYTHITRLMNGNDKSNDSNDMYNKYEQYSQSPIPYEVPVRFIRLTDAVNCFGIIGATMATVEVQVVLVAHENTHETRTTSNTAVRSWGV